MCSCQKSLGASASVGLIRFFASLIFPPADGSYTCFICQHPVGKVRLFLALLSCLLMLSILSCLGPSGR